MALVKPDTDSERGLCGCMVGALVEFTRGLSAIYITLPGRYIKE